MLSSPLLVHVLALFAGTLPTLAADVRGVSLTVGQGWAVGRELRQVTMPGGSAEIVLDDIPEEADLSSLLIRMQSCGSASACEDRVRMRSLGYAETTDRAAEERFEIVLENRTGIPVQAKFEAQPPYALKWDAVRSSETYARERGRLRFSPVINGYSDKRIE